MKVMKRCSKCGKNKPLNDFWQARSKSHGRDWRCKECKREYMREYNKRPTSRELRRKQKPRKSERERIYLKKLRKKAFEVIANGQPIKCLRQKEWKCCSYSDFDFLTFDHIYNDGAEDRKKSLVAQKLYGWIIKNPQEARKKLQILCRNAQAKKELERIRRAQLFDYSLRT